MKIRKQYLFCTIFLCTNIIISAQTESFLGTKQTNNVIFSDPDNLPPQPVNAIGFPSRAADLDVLPGFQNPPAGYGEVPFWWWSGEKLNKDRILWQIEELHKKGIAGMQVNYIHSDVPGEWKTIMDDPKVFSDEWWDYYKFAAEQCNKRGMGIGLSGYTIDWPEKNNLFNSIIYSIPEIQGVELKADTTISVSSGEKVVLKVSDKTIGVWAYPAKDGKIQGRGKSIDSYLKNFTLTWTPEKGEWQIWVFTTERKPGTINPMHPKSGKTVIDKFFQPFQDNAVNQSSDGLNYFFQDELQFGVGDRIWTEDFDEVFKKQKGYDVFELLPSMFTDMGDLTVKGRLDFMDVKVQLTEERYFKPIFDWHWSRGKIYGCDPEGRGREPGMYGDNFRAIRWYTAPGHDTPGGQADLIKGKVSSSIAALYKRPRVWLEGYHSLGWGAAPERLMFATCENYLYGCNLLNLHGLYYTTYGSFWEWAPPCYHFRMPYWDHMGVFLKYFERLSYLLSQGVLQADVAIMYPVSPVQAEMDGDKATQTAFDTGTELFNNGHDFIFMDDQSLARANTEEGKIRVSDMTFRVLVLPSMKAIRWSTVQKALSFFRNGGTVISVGSLPMSSDRAGSNDPQLDAAIKEIFGISAKETGSEKAPEKQVNRKKGTGIIVRDATELKTEIDKLLPRHVASDRPVKAMHRKIGTRDVYMVMGAAKDSYCTFRSGGNAELWDPWTGKTRPLFTKNDNKEVSEVKMPLDTNEAQIIVFSHIDKGMTATDIKRENNNTANVSSQMILDGDWEFELKPTMDNRWGDFRLPVTSQMIGAEARIFSYSKETSDATGWELSGFDDSKWPRVTYGFGPKFWKLGPLPDNIDTGQLDKQLSSLKNIDYSKPVIINGKSYKWQPYNFSWRFGVEGDPGHQGYHGLKEFISNDFICLGKPTEGLNEILYKEEEEGTCYYLSTSAFVEKSGKANIEMGGLKPDVIILNRKKIEDPSLPLKLNQGRNPLLLRYNKPGRGHFVMLMTVSPEIEVKTPLSMKWGDLKGLV
ncbi:MAG TPA: glycosyl hydrolase, partial [Bacteroidales bacterium]|nr:glycosyl hydrolase [Bacteroidales bacterium]